MKDRTCVRRAWYELIRQLRTQPIYSRNRYPVLQVLRRTATVVPSEILLVKIFLPLVAEATPLIPITYFHSKKNVSLEWPQCLLRVSLVTQDIKEIMYCYIHIVMNKENCIHAILLISLYMYTFINTNNYNNHTGSDYT